MVELDFNLIGRKKAQLIEANLLGFPTENRILLAVNANSEKKTDSGLYIPSNGNEDLPKKGVVVAKGVTNDDRVHFDINIGDIILYGKYGGKEIYPSFAQKIEGVEDLKFYVLSSSEVIFIEPNKD